MMNTNFVKANLQIGIPTVVFLILLAYASILERSAQGTESNETARSATSIETPCEDAIHGRVYGKDPHIYALFIVDSAEVGKELRNAAGVFQEISPVETEMEFKLYRICGNGDVYLTLSGVGSFESRASLRDHTLRLLKSYSGDRIYRDEALTDTFFRILGGEVLSLVSLLDDM